MKKYVFIITLLLGLIFSNCYAQKETNYWYFGQYAGLDFNSGTPVALADGALYTREGCATISDKNGNLLFYTDGVTVWNKLHQVMENGTDLGGHFSSSQSAIIVKKPGSDSLYYIFTGALQQTWPNDNDNLEYSIVNINANNGLGKVIIKNMFLFEPITESLTATMHINNKDVWIITHKSNSNEFCCFLLDSTDINTTPVVSTVGAYHSSHFAGCIEVSSSGIYIGCGNHSSSRYELFDFDNETGILSNPISFPGYFAYGLEFSHDETKLYLADGSELYQINLLAGSPGEIVSSATLVGNTDVHYIATMQVGPDQKIYCTVFSRAYLGVINNPNTLGINCDYDDNGIYLEGRTAELGLPNFLNVNYTSVISYQDTCFGDSTYFTINYLDSTQTISWNFGDTASGINNTSNLQNPAHLFSATGDYIVTTTVTTNIDTNIYTTEVLITSGPSSPTIVISTDSVCQGSSNVLFAINPIENADSIIWNLMPDSAGIIFGSDTVIHINFSPDYSGQTTLQVHGINECGNGDTTFYTIDVLGYPVSNAGNDTTICENMSCTLNGGSQNGDHTYWATLGDGTFDNRFILNATYTPGFEDIENGNADLVLFAFSISPCLGEVGDTLNLTIINSPEVNAGEDDSICAGESYLLSGTSENDSSTIWITSGDGIFDNPQQLSTYYYPGPEDILEGKVILTLSASPVLPCEDIISDSIAIYINTIPNKPETPVGPQFINLDTCISSSYYTHNTSNTTHYQWVLNPDEAGEIIGDGIESTVYWNNSFNGLVAYIYVEALNDCGGNNSDSLVVDISPVGLSYKSINPEINITPNPSNGVFNVEIYGIKNNVHIYITDNIGNLIRKRSISCHSTKFMFQVDLSDKSSGVYYISFVIENIKSIGYKLVKQ